MVNLFKLRTMEVELRLSKSARSLHEEFVYFRTMKVEMEEETREPSGRGSR